MARALNQYPDLLTLEEAAEYLRISRALGYQLARQYRITDGAAGLPVVPGRFSLIAATEQTVAAITRDS